MTESRPVCFDIEPGLRLELLHPKRARELFQVVDGNRMFLRRWLPWVDATQSAADTRPFLEASWHGYLRGEGFSLGIIHKEQLVGVIGFHAFDYQHRVTSLGYWLAEAATGKGLMTRSVSRCLDYAFDEQNMNRLYLRCAAENEPSRAIPERLGFTYEGRQREAERLDDRYVDLDVYSILAREWDAQRLNRLRTSRA